MKKRILIGLIILTFVSISISSVLSQITKEDIVTSIKSGSTGVNFEDNSFGGMKVNIMSPESVVTYRDVNGKSYTLTGLSKDSILELDSNGNLIRGNFISEKSFDAIFSGNIKVNIPANSKVIGTNGKSFDVLLPLGSKVEKEPSSLNPDKNKGDNFVNYKTSGKSNIKFPEFELQNGIVSHNGKNFVIESGNNAVLNGISLSNSVKDGNSAIFFNQGKIPADYKGGYTLIDQKNKYVKSVGADGKISSVSFTPDNPIAKVSTENRLSYKAGALGQVNIKNQGSMIYTNIQGKFAMSNGQLYLYHQGRGLIGFFNRLFGNYYTVPIQMSIVSPDGTALLSDRNGNFLGIMVGTGKNGLPQLSTIPQPSPTQPVITPPGNTKPEIPNWQHNPDNSPVPGPSLTNIPQPVKPATGNPVPAPPTNNYPFTKQEFLRDLYSTQTGFLLNIGGYGPNFGKALEAADPTTFQKHFGAGSTTTLDQTLTDYKRVIVTLSGKFGTTPATAADLFKSKQPTLYNKYGKYLGFS